MDAPASAGRATSQAAIAGLRNQSASGPRRAPAHAAPFEGGPRRGDGAAGGHLKGAVPPAVMHQFHRPGTEFVRDTGATRWIAPPGRISRMARNLRIAFRMQHQ